MFAKQLINFVIQNSFSKAIRLEYSKYIEMKKAAKCLGLSCNQRPNELTEGVGTYMSS